MYTILILAVVFGALVALAFRLMRQKNIDIVVSSSIKRRRDHFEGRRHVFFCFVDHYEPLWMRADDATGRKRVEAWVDRYPQVVDAFRDNAGRPPQHTFFYPEEEYRPEYLEMLTKLCELGYGDVEIHLHHDGDTSDGLRSKLMRFKETLHNRHGLLRRNKVTDAIEYGFIHGNWALDDSRPDGRWCGVKDEITVLKETGCYADFTFPSAPHPTQPPIINQFYYCVDDPQRSSSHHKGKEVVYGAGSNGDLLLATGPLAINWRQRRRWILPALENGDIAAYSPPTQDRVDLWVRTGIAVRGWPNWIFIKVHTHGAQENNAGLLLGRDVAPLYERLLGRYNDGENFVMHFVTARELFECVKALEQGDEERIRRIEQFTYDP